MLVSVIVTVRNEAENIDALLDSLVTQEGPAEVIVVDADSQDGTPAIVADYGRRYPFVKLVRRGGTRGQGRNFGVRLAAGEAVAFIDGDCIANPFWLRFLRERLGDAHIAAGRTIPIGYRPFQELERVELIVRGYDVTYPAANLAYRTDVFRSAGGFDPWFVTAEDIDLNLRAVTQGHRIAYEPRAVVYHRTRSSVYDFIRQAFWNGAGRKQLTLKHGSLWSRYRIVEMLRREATFWSLMRLVGAMAGYIGYKAFGRRRTT